jgi:hypothetical protein
VNIAELPVLFSCGRFVSADDRLDVTGLFDAVVSAPQNPVSRKTETDIGRDSFDARCRRHHVKIISLFLLGIFLGAGSLPLRCG